MDGTDSTAGRRCHAKYRRAVAGVVVPANRWIVPKIRGGRIFGYTVAVQVAAGFGRIAPQIAGAVANNDQIGNLPGINQLLSGKCLRPVKDKYQTVVDSGVIHVAERHGLRRAQDEIIRRTEHEGV